MIPLAAPWIRPEYAERVQRQVLSTFIGPGTETQAFAAALAAYIGRRYCVPTTSGTTALSLAVQAAGASRVAIPAYGVISVINAVAHHAEPVLVDIDRETGCMSPNALEHSLSSQRIDAVCYVDFAGCVDDGLARVGGICREYNVPLIEDAACALGHVRQGKRAGSFGTVSALSFAPQKLITTGQGGAVLTDDHMLSREVEELIDHGGHDWRSTNLNVAMGTNLRFNDVLAALGLAQIDNIIEIGKRKVDAHKRLWNVLGSYLYSSPSGPPLFNIVFSIDSDRLVNYLRELGVGAVRQYRTYSQHPFYQDVSVAGPTPNADWWTDHAVYLPYGLALEDEELNTIAEAVMAREELLIDWTRWHE